MFFFYKGGGAQHPLGPENPLKSINNTGPGGGWAPIAPLNTPQNKDDVFSGNFSQVNKFTRKEKEAREAVNWPLLLFPCLCRSIFHAV